MEFLFIRNEHKLGQTHGVTRRCWSPDSWAPESFSHSSLKAGSQNFRALVGIPTQSARCPGPKAVRGGLEHCEVAQLKSAWPRSPREEWDE